MGNPAMDDLNEKLSIFRSMSDQLDAAYQARKAAAAAVVEAARHPDVPVDVDAMIAGFGDGIKYRDEAAMTPPSQSGEDIARNQGAHKEEIDAQKAKRRAEIELAARVALGIAGAMA